MCIYMYNMYIYTSTYLDIYMYIFINIHMCIYYILTIGYSLLAIRVCLPGAGP